MPVSPLFGPASKVKKAAGGVADPRAAVLALSPELLYDMNDNATMYQDEAKSTAVASTSDPVAVVEDLGSTGEALVIDAGQTARRPLRTADGIAFDGVNDGLLKAYTSLSLSNPYTVIFSCKSNVFGNNDYLWAGDAGGGYYPAMLIYDTAGDRDFVFNPPYATSAGTGWDHGTTYNIFAIKYISGSSACIMRRNGVELAGATIGTARAFEALALGRAYGHATAFNSNVDFRHFFVKDGAMSDGDIGTVEAWMDDGLGVL